MANVALCLACHAVTLFSTAPEPLACWATSSEGPAKCDKLVRRVFELATERQVPVRLDTKRGKGSDATLYFGNRKTVVKY